AESVSDGDGRPAAAGGSGGEDDWVISIPFTGPNGKRRLKVNTRLHLGRVHEVENVPMREVDPILFADDLGVWRRSPSGYRSGIEWDEIYRVSGYKLDGITEAYTVLEVDFEYGEFIEFNHIWAGFNEIVTALTARLPGISPGWFEQIEKLQPRDDP